MRQREQSINELVWETERLIILDMGGYFAPSIIHIHNYLTATLAGVIEDTENGHQRYDHILLPCPVISVARSPLKDPEDFLVGQSIVFSTEAILREIDIILMNKLALVIGYGKLGRSIAQLLSRRGVRTSVYDIDPVMQVQAFSHGFNLSAREDGLAHSHLVFCATGNKSLQGNDFSLLKEGCFVATVTSADDELDMASLTVRYSHKTVHQHVQLHYNNGHSL